MKKGIIIKFGEEDNCYFQNEFNRDIDYHILIIALLETLNDICKEYDLNFKKQIEKYLELGSVDDYIGVDK